MEINLAASAAGPSAAAGEPPLKKYKKKTEDFILPTKDNFSKILSINNYTIKQFKEIAAHYKIKLGSASLKSDIRDRIYNYFDWFDTATLLQRNWRRVLLKQYNALRGPARFNRSLCVNETDFFTMDSLHDIPYAQFYSFKDKDNMIYGFDILSLYNLFDKTYDKTYDKVTNPYNRQLFPKLIYKNILQLLRLGTIFNDEITISMVEPKTTNEIVVVSIENRTIALFHDIDILGNYTNYIWFYSLLPQQIIRYILELRDIWSYRANLSEEARREICPTHNYLFRSIQENEVYLYSTSMLQDLALNIMEKMVRSGVNQDSRCLGANYVLCALTLVSSEAALALPWLFQSVI
jgi:hypothetical protein